MAGAVDLFVAIKFVKLLTTPFEEWDAFKLGLIDKDGIRLKYAKTPEEKKAMDIFHIMVRNLKKLLNKIPGGKTRFASLAAGLYLIKETVEKIDEDTIKAIEAELYKQFGIDLNENINIDMTSIKPGKYVIENESLPYNAAMIIVKENIEPFTVVLNTPLFKYQNVVTRETIYFTEYDIKPIL